jgi:molybdopterin-containing oxidoreductase family iron-sulfur binding subunit
MKPQYEGKGLTPFELAHKSDHKLGAVGKCDFCKDRVAAGSKPKCVETCPAKARIFGDLDDPNSEVAMLVVRRNGEPLHPEFGTKPSVYYLKG